MIKLADFWTNLKLYWLRRHHYTKIVKSKIHNKGEVGLNSFCPVSYNIERFEKTRKRGNPIWREIYITLNPARYKDRLRANQNLMLSIMANIMEIGLRFDDISGLISDWRIY